MGSSGRNETPREADCRRPGASGIAARLADGGLWLLARPNFRADRPFLTVPNVDAAIDQIFEHLVLNEAIPATLIRQTAVPLLRANYTMSVEQARGLVDVAAGGAMKDLAASLIDALFGGRDTRSSFTSWVRASLCANGLGSNVINASDVPQILSVLAVTNRTIPLSDYAEVCHDAEERDQLDSLL